MLHSIKRRLEIIFTELKRDLKNFPLYITRTDFLYNVFCVRNSTGKLAARYKKNRENDIYAYLENCCADVIQKHSTLDLQGKKSNKKQIWICWLQGEENAPVLIKKCIRSVRVNNPGCEITVLNLENYRDYVKISPELEEKYKKGEIGNAHFSDIIRVNLIGQNGGLWLDATIFCTGRIPDEVFEAPFFTCKSERITGFYISEYQWTTFVFGGLKGSGFYVYMSDFYDKYWMNNTAAIDYLFMDYIIDIGRKKIESVGRMVETVPMNNLRRDELQALFNEPFDKDKFEELIESDTYLHKLSWRLDFKKHTDDGRQTFFGYFVDEYNS